MIMTLVCALLAISSAHPGPQATQSVKFASVCINLSSPSITYPHAWYTLKFGRW
ncbi:hypothetical protein PVAP13_2KG578659 [Panicum virgatum]|uniref:Uncharacterized protein n=1 Tax=Panicum virgatum TaxID=38727 RepID=A0A8T0WCP9_PANVG|nr:hypothetical protein PVAP13_2KG578659 [Panicum virgatum]